jgi:uncharacterized repeat protein (TIGR01451 family)
MKLKSKTTSLTFRLVSLVAALLLGQQALAAGTEAGTTVDNTASVDYFVGGIDQTDVTSNTVSFVVDRRVNFTLDLVNTGDLVAVSPGGTDYFVEFLLTNVSNSDLDFDLALAQVAAGIDVDGQGNDDSDMATLDYAISGDVVSGTNPDPVRGVNTTFVDELGSDEAIRIRVYGDAALAMTDGQISGAELTATAREAGAAGLGAALDWINVTNVDATIQNVDVNGNDGVEVAIDGFVVETANLSVAKSYAIVDGDLGSGLPIPGTRLQYEIVISNAAGASDATDIVITDQVDSDLTFLTGGTGGAFTDIQVDDGGGPVECTADDPGVDSDGCSLDGSGNLVIGDATNRPITIVGGASYTVRFQVRINDPATTP